MIKEVKIRNFKNFRDEIVFSLTTHNNYEFNKHIIQNNVINTAIIVGGNASGKTNLGIGILDIINHLTDKKKKFASPYSNLYNKDKTVYFEYLFEFDGVEVLYKYEKIKPEKVIREQLYIDGKSVILNDATGVYVKLNGTENLNISLFNGESISLVKYVFSNTILDENDLEAKAFISFMKFVNGMMWISSTLGNEYIGFTDESGNVFEKIIEHDSDASGLQNFLHEHGIDYKLIVKDNGEGKNIYCKMGDETALLGSLVSSGTMALVFFYLWYIQNEKISFLYIDEFDAFYHTNLSIEVLKSIIKIPNLQSVITSHNTDLLSNEIMRPDCIFSLKNNKLTVFSDLTKKALREAHNLQKMYKAGAFDEQ